MNLHVPTRQLKTGCGRQLISLCLAFQVCPLRLSLQRVRHFKHHTYFVALLISIFTLCLPIAEGHELLNSIINKIFVLQPAYSYMYVKNISSPASAYSVHYTAILGVLILPVPTLIDFF